MTQFEEMKAVLLECGKFSEQEIAQLFTDAHVGRHSRYSHEDDDHKWSEEDEEQEATIDRELVIFIAQREAFDRATDDGRCLKCEGWGCDTCDHTGGY
jgi:hypothetical protein